MNAAVFDPDTFLNQTVDAALDTKYPTVPAGEYPATISKIEARQMPNQKDPEKGPFTVLDVTWKIDDENAKKETGLDEPTCRQSLFLDMTPEGGLDTAPKKNVQLGRLREALGLNEDGQAFSFNMLVGQAALVRVDHAPSKTDPETVYANVTKVAPF